ncbi:hypothetical protein D3C87_1585210 [compost metagenome]
MYSFEYVNPSPDKTHPDPGVTFESVNLTFDVIIIIALFVFELYCVVCFNSTVLTSVTTKLNTFAVPSSNMNVVL